ncbi:chaperone modulator CbpM [Streptosporangium sp. NPDC048865]|uniref:chaperone modulator CbpM n=1 Tax=Streptosporangium sp. NPDC048865 TaxID=3155766 RepID=UPI00343428CD
MTCPFPERGTPGPGPRPAGPRMNGMNAMDAAGGERPGPAAASRPGETPARTPAQTPRQARHEVPRETPLETVRTYQLTRPERLDLETFARATGTHPELVRRLVALGVLDAWADAAGHLWFPPSQLLAMARIRRLRAGFSINYAALGLVLDLLDRIADLEAAQRGRHRPTGGPSWT